MSETTSTQPEQTYHIGSGTPYPKTPAGLCEAALDELCSSNPAFGGYCAVDPQHRAKAAERLNNCPAAANMLNMYPGGADTKIPVYNRKGADGNPISGTGYRPTVQTVVGLRATTLERKGDPSTIWVEKPASGVQGNVGSSGASAGKIYDLNNPEDLKELDALKQQRLEGTYKRYSELAAKYENNHPWLPFSTQIAAENLRHYLDGSGGTKIMSHDWLLSFDAIGGVLGIGGAINKNKSHFEDDLKFAENIMEREGLNEYMVKNAWDASVVPLHRLSELAIASGESLLSSVCEIEVKKDTDGFIISGVVYHIWSDDYDWNKGQLFWLGPEGTYYDDDAAELEPTYAKGFCMRGYWKQTLKLKKGLLFDSIEWSESQEMTPDEINYAEKINIDYVSQEFKSKRQERYLRCKISTQ